MESDPLFHVKQLFYQASYKACITEAAAESHKDLSDDEGLDRTLYAARANLALGSSSAAQSLLSGQSDAPRFKAVKVFADYLETKEEGKVDEIRDLVLEFDGEEAEEVNVDEAVVRAMAGTVFILAGENEEAVATLSEGCGKRDLECTAILVQLLLSLDRKDLAQTTYNAAKAWGDDSLLIQQMEAWIGMKSGGKGLQQSYYLYEELYQLPSGRTPNAFAAHAAAHTLMGHIDEAKADISQALERDLGNQKAEVYALGVTLGLDGMDSKLREAAPDHPFILALDEKSKAFDEAAAKFAVTA